MQQVNSHGVNDNLNMKLIFILIFSPEFYQQFLVEDFDVKEHASQVLQGSVVSEQLSKLSEGCIIT